MSNNRFCRLYTEHTTVARTSLQVAHKARRNVEMDCSGSTMQLLNPTTSEISTVHLFVAFHPFWKYTLFDVSLDILRKSKQRAHAAIFAFLADNVPRRVLDKLKIWVIPRACQGGIVLNNSYREMTAHYSAAVLLAERGFRKNKSSVENAVSLMTT